MLAGRVKPAETFRGGIGQRHQRRQDAWLAGGSCRGAHDSLLLQNMFSCKRASSVIRLGSQGGSQTVSTSQSVTPATPITASFTCSGNSWALGQAGAVNVISTLTLPVSRMSIV